MNYSFVPYIQVLDESSKELSEKCQQEFSEWAAQWFLGENAHNIIVENCLGHRLLKQTFSHGLFEDNVLVGFVNFTEYKERLCGAFTGKLDNDRSGLSQEQLEQAVTLAIVQSFESCTKKNDTLELRDLSDCGLTSREALANFSGLVIKSQGKILGFLSSFTVARSNANSEKALEKVSLKPLSSMIELNDKSLNIECVIKHFRVPARRMTSLSVGDVFWTQNKLKDAFSLESSQEKIGECYLARKQNNQVIILK